MDQRSWSSLSEKIKKQIVALICQNYETSTLFENYIRESDLIYPYCHKNERYKFIPMKNIDGLRIYIRELIDFSKIYCIQQIIDILTNLSLNDVTLKVKELLTNGITSTSNENTNNILINSMIWKELSDNAKKQIINILSQDFIIVLQLEEHLRNNNILNNSIWNHLNWLKDYPRTQEQKRSLVKIMLNFQNVMKLSDISFGLYYLDKPNIADMICEIIENNRNDCYTESDDCTKSNDFELSKIKNKLYNKYLITNYIYI